jgi:hypothetical protein
MTRTRALGAVAVLTLVATALVVSASAAAAEPAGRSEADGAAGLAEPELALQRALALFAPARVSARYSSAVAGADPREATVVLRDLIAQTSSLRPSDRRLAARLLARPTDGASEGPAGYNAAARTSKERFCNPRFCIHWVKKSDERPSLRDRSPRNGRPDYVDKTIANMNTTWATEIGRLGYKEPLSDRGSGKHRGGNPNGKIDIFIANIGDFGLYGYCTTDDRRARSLSHRQNSAYCVIDDDFSPWEFQSGATRNAANKVTLAHEFFHAVQFAYDTFDKAAMMEGTATWIEDQVFSHINDNRQYFSTSPLGRFPWKPLDHFANSGTFALWQYGTWIWYRFLSENLGRPNTDRPLVVRKIWQQAVGGSRNGFGAIEAALSTEGTNVHEQMTKFGEWNAAPGAAGHYREANQGSGYPTPGAVTTEGNAPTAAGVPVDLSMSRRSNDYVKIRPSSTLGPGATLQFSNVSIPTAAGDVQAIVFRNGSVDPPVEVANGNSVDFDHASVAKVVFVLTNASGSSFGHFKFNAIVNP